MTERFGSVEISDTCGQFVQLFRRATLPYLYEIESSSRKIQLAIGEDNMEKGRVRRGLINAVQKMANILYGVYSKIDVEFIFNKILELNQSGKQSITLIPERTRITRAEPEHQAKKLLQHQQKLEENLQYLKNQTKGLIQTINKLEFRTKLLEQAFLFEVLLNQYSYETLNLMSIVNSAINGRIHTSVFSSEQLLLELREIKMNLPGGTTFPLEIKAESLTQLIQISDLAIVHKEHYLVFSLGIPLISVQEYTMYHPISLPIQYDDNTIALIAPEVDYLALSNDNEKFFLLGANQWESCVKLESYTLCKGDQPIHYPAGSNLCDVSRISDLQSPLKDCRVNFITLNAPVWHRLTKANSWLYFTQSDLCTIKCSDPPQTFKVEISGVGRLTTSPSCEIHTENSILVANGKNNRDISLDIIPVNRKFNIISMLAEIRNSFLPQNLTNVKILKDLNFLARKAEESRVFEHKPMETWVCIFRIEFHIAIMYIFIISVALSIGTVVIKFRNRVIKMYKPEIGNGISINDQVNP